MKILFFGNASFGIPTLEKLVKSSHQVISVVTNKDKKAGRGNFYQSTPIKKWSNQNNVSTLEENNLSSLEFINKINSMNPDLIVVIAFKLLPESIFNIPAFGTMNLHASLLPKYRGAAPIQRAILNGEKKTGVTTFFIDEKIDTGKIIIQKELDVQDDDNSGTIHNKLSEIGGSVVLDSIDHIENNKELTEQEEGGTYAKKIKKNEYQIYWNDSAANIFNKVRAFSPNPSSFSYLENKRIKILSSKISKDINLSPGVILTKEKRLYVGTSTEPLEITEVQVEGKNKMNASDFINGLIFDENNEPSFEFRQ